MYSAAATACKYSIKEDVAKINEGASVESNLVICQVLFEKDF